MFDQAAVGTQSLTRTTKKNGVAEPSPSDVTLECAPEGQPLCTVLLKRHLKE